jgi:phosphoserine phosphatase
MSFVVTIIGNPAARAVTPAHAADVRDALSLHGATPAPPSWLAPETACDIPFDAAPGFDEAGLGLVDHILHRLAGDPVDVVLQPQAHRRKKLIVADMDSTIIEQECVDELADFAGLKSCVAEITQRAMNGELAFEPALKERVALLKGLETAVLEQVYRERITLTPGARTLIATMRASSAASCLVSGGFQFFVERVARAAGFDVERCNDLLSKDGQLTGEVREPIFGRESKRATLIEFRDKHAVDPKETLAVGDGANDLGMIEEAGLGVAFRPHPVLAKAADAVVRHGDLTAILYLQGYREDEFIRP